MLVNPNIEKTIQIYIECFLDEHKICSIKDVIDNCDVSIKATKAELIKTINQALMKKNIVIIDEKIPWENSNIVLVKRFLFTNSMDYTSIVISKPRLRELSLRNIEQRNKLIDTITCFEEIITSSTQILRICSPFVQENVIDNDSFPKLRELLTNALRRDVEIKLLSRELFQGRATEIQWIIDAANNLRKRDRLKIVDYHLLSENGSILSSTHAKLIVADFSLAYVGSAELRKNSLTANFEVGCLVRGPQVFAICEIFDNMFSSGRMWDA